MITQKKLKELLHYDQYTGIFTWSSPGRGRNSSGIAGCLDSIGYTKISIGGKNHLTHRLAWFYVHGVWPENIDHINHIRHDNRWLNLREVTHQENCKNRSQQKNNTSGICGVHWCKSRKKWCAQIKANGKVMGLGRFTDKSGAIFARKTAENKYGYHINYGDRK